MEELQLSSRMGCSLLALSLVTESQNSWSPRAMSPYGYSTLYEVWYLHAQKKRI